MDDVFPTDDDFGGPPRPDPGGPGGQRGMRIDPSAGGDYPLDKMTRAGGSGKRRAAQMSVHDTAGRLPPQATDVERSVLGALMIDKDAINRALEVLPEDPFYDGRHQRIYAAVRALSERSDPVDLITLTQELRRRGDLDAAGGAAYLSELTGKVASAANVEYHARIIAERSLLRRFIETATLLVGKAYDPATDAFELLDEAEKDIFAISNLKKTNAARPLGDVVKVTLARLESISGAEGGLTGVPSAIRSLDQLTAGWQPSDLIIVAARPSMGKCLGKGTRVLMFDGTTRAVEDVQVGDLLMGDDSTPRRVLSLARGREEMVWVRQKHGMDYRVNASHILSLKKSRAGGRVPRGTVVNVEVREAMARSAKWRNDHKGYKVAVDFPAQPVPIDPYILGVWLGDGKSDSARIYTRDHEVVDSLAAYAERRGAHLTAQDIDRCPAPAEGGEQETRTVTAGRSHTSRETSLQAELRRLGVLGNKHLPHVYLANDRPTRLALLAGLIDSDGHCNKGHGGTYEITLCNEAMARQVKFLCDTLGYRTSLRSKRASIRATGFEGTAWRVRFNGNVDEIPVRIDRKKAAPWTDRRDWTVTGLVLERDGVGEYYGFTLDGNRLFVLEDGTVTHNTAFSLAVARNAALHPDRPAGVAYFSLEMSSDQLAQRLLTSEARVDAQVARTGRMSDVEWQQIARAAGRLLGAPIFIDDTPGLGILELRAKCRRLKAEHDIGLIVVDYLQLMHGSGGGKNANREQEIAQISRSLKGLAKDLNVPVIALSQLSRAVENRPDKRPQLSDLRESGCLTGDTCIPLPDGRRARLADLVAAHPDGGFDVWAADEATGRIGPARVSRAFSTGVKPVFRLTTRLGRTIRATGNHPFLTIDGWKRLDALRTGEHIAAPRRLDVPAAPATRTDAELALLGHLLGDGCTLPRHAIQYTTREHDLAETVAQLASNDLYWDEVVAIVPDGEEEVFDLTVPGPHNFVADDLIVHNSIEQDADVVIFLHRPEKYGITTDDAGQSTEGIAEIIVGKQRNGPLGTAVAAFVKEYARFENLTTYYDGAGGYGNEPEDPFAQGPSGGAPGLPPPDDYGYGPGGYGGADLPGGVGPPPGGYGDGGGFGDGSSLPPYPPDPGDAPF